MLQTVWNWTSFVGSVDFLLLCAILFVGSIIFQIMLHMYVPFLYLRACLRIKPKLVFTNLLLYSNLHVILDQLWLWWSVVIMMDQLWLCWVQFFDSSRCLKLFMLWWWCSGRDIIATGTGTVTLFYTVRQFTQGTHKHCTSQWCLFYHTNQPIIVLIVYMAG